MGGTTGKWDRIEGCGDGLSRLELEQKRYPWPQCIVMISCNEYNKRNRHMHSHKLN